MAVHHGRIRKLGRLSWALDSTTEYWSVGSNHNPILFQVQLRRYPTRHVLRFLVHRWVFFTCWESK